MDKSLNAPLPGAFAIVLLLTLSVLAIVTGHADQAAIFSVGAIVVVVARALAFRIVVEMRVARRITVNIKREEAGNA